MPPTPAALVSIFAALETGVTELRGRVHAQEDLVTGLRETVRRHEDEAAILTLTTTALEALLHQVQLESLGEIEEMVSFGLHSVFPDLSLAFKLDVTQKRGVTVVEPSLRIGAIEGSVIDSYGGGVAAVTAFLLRLLVVRRAGLAPLILCDESFSMVSEQYIENLSQLLRELAKRFHMVILVITHSTALAAAADRHYEISDSENGAVFTRRDRDA